MVLVKNKLWIVNQKMLSDILVITSHSRSRGYEVKEHFFLSLSEQKQCQKFRAILLTKNFSITVFPPKTCKTQKTRCFYLKYNKNLF